METKRYTEWEQMNTQQFTFRNLRPGGNDTCLVTMNGFEPTVQTRKRINKFIQNVYPNIEQVGFVNLDPKDASLKMSGNEFCGNATRSAAWLCLKGKPGEILISVSGVKDKLRAGVKENGEAFAQMPVFADPDKITKKSPTGYLVQMEGITHYVDFTLDATKGLSDEQIKAKANKQLEELGLKDQPAAGIIYTSIEKDGLRIDPVVYVRDIDTLYYETACGSGTTAVGMIMAKDLGKAIDNVPIMQPSDLPIKVSVDYDGIGFRYAQIQGEVEELSSGSGEINEQNAFVTEQITRWDTLTQALNPGLLVNLYQNIFAQPPYNESFDPNEVEEIFTDYVSNGLVYVAKSEAGVIGFAAALPVNCVPEIATILTQANCDITDSWYIAEVGVKEDARRQNIARKLLKRTLAQAGKAFMRTSVDNLASQNLFRSLDFIPVPNALQYVEQDRTDGTSRTDKRIFLQKPYGCYR